MNQQPGEAEVEGVNSADPGGAVPPALSTTQAELLAQLEEVYVEATGIVENDASGGLLESCGEIGTVVSALAATKHAARGALLTLLLYKSCQPGQDIRSTKSEHPGGFSARAIDSGVTVPFLLRESLPRNVETHFLSQTLSFGDQWTRNAQLRTTPKAAGPLLIDAVNRLEELPPDEQKETARRLAVAVLVRLVEERNRGRVLLTRPKELTIASVLEHIDLHFNTTYKTGAAPRLPQLAIYAIYECLFSAGVGRYSEWTLDRLRRMKAADRKAGTVGDIVVSDGSRPVEAVETKFGMPINIAMVAEAMEKIRAASVKRYFVLSTVGVVASEHEEILKRCKDFRRSNGCEVIVNGVLETIQYYLRLIPSTTSFIDAYASLVEKDDDLSYEHRVAWNAICERLAG